MSDIVNPVVAAVAAAAVAAEPEHMNPSPPAPAPEPAPAPQPAAADVIAAGPGAVLNVPAQTDQRDSGDETTHDATTAPAVAEPKTHKLYAELSAIEQASVNHARHFAMKLHETFDRVEHAGVEDAKKALAWALAAFEDALHRITG